MSKITLFDYGCQLPLNLFLPTMFVILISWNITIFLFHDDIVLVDIVIKRVMNKMP